MTARMTMSKALVGVFQRAEDLTTCLDELQKQGVEDMRLSVLATEERTRQKLENEGDVPETAVLASQTGAIPGGFAGGMSSVGTFAAGGLGLMVAGPLLAVFRGAGPGTDAGHGGPLYKLADAGFEERIIQHLEDRLQTGNVLLIVDMEDGDDEEEVNGQLQEHGAREVIES